MNNIFQIGLTGGIGSGKSTVAAIFKTIGIPVFNADIEAKSMMNTDEIIQQKICNLFGNESYVNGTLNRQFIASIVFNNKAALEQLNAIVHPAILERYKSWLVKQKSKYVVKEAAILFEANTYKNLDFIIGVTAPLQLRIQRVMQRDKISRAQIEARIKSQMDEDEKLKLCNAIIINDEKTLLFRQFTEIVNSLNIN